MLLPSRLVAPLILFALAACPLACKKDEPPPAGTSAPAPAATQSAATQSAAFRHRGLDRATVIRRHGGPVDDLLQASQRLRRLSNAERGAIRSVEDQESAEDTGTAEKERAEADLAAGIHAGQIDAAKMKGDFAAMDAAVQVREQHEAAELQALFDALKPAQRESLIGALRATEAARARSAPQTGAEASPVPARNRAMAAWTDKLGLDAPQQQRLRAILEAEDPSSSGPTPDARREHARLRLEAVVSAWERANQDGTKLNLSAVPPRSRHDEIEVRTAFIAKLLPLLKPDQRDAIVDGPEPWMANATTARRSSP